MIVGCCMDTIWHQDPPLHAAGEVPDFLNFARKAVVSETTHLKEAWQRGVSGCERWVMHGKVARLLGYKMLYGVVTVIFMGYVWDVYIYTYCTV